MTTPQPDRPTVLLVGTFHIGATSDLHRPATSDVRAAAAQHQFRTLVDRLTRFRPTAVAVEVTADQQERLDDAYRAYRAGRRKPGDNEVEQVGFRVAAAGLHRLHAVDRMGQGTRGLGDVYEWARERQPDLWREIFEDPPSPMSEGAQGVLDLYRHANDPALLRDLHRRNVLAALVGEAADHVGVDWLQWWYRRNLILFANISRLATAPTDRVLVLIGASHVELLDQLLRDGGRVHVARAGDYLDR